MAMIPWIRRIAVETIASLPQSLANHRVLRIALYHRVGLDGNEGTESVAPAQFRRQLRWLKRHFHMLAPAYLGRPMLNDASRPSALVTFDDGFLEQYTH